MRFTVTPLGGARGDGARVVDAIVRYLLPPARPAPGAPPTGPSRSAGAGPGRYYADGGEEPGRWFGRSARVAGLDGVVARGDFAAVLAGRDPSTGERLITAQGSAGRRPTLGAGTPSRVGADGEPLYDVADAAAALGVSHREAERMLDVGAAVAVAGLASAAPADRSAVQPPEYRGHRDPARDRLAVQPTGAAAPDHYPAEHPGGNGTAGARPTEQPSAALRQPPGSFLVPIIDPDGSRLVTQTELARCDAARQAGVAPETIRAVGNPDDQLPIGEAARLAGVTTRYLRRLARYHEDRRSEIDHAIAAGRQPRNAYLVAHRGTKGRWLVTRENLARSPTASTAPPASSPPGNSPTPRRHQRARPGDGPVRQRGAPSRASGPGKGS